jgi:uncharacterized membrane protein YdjX (TVP38/TMEM64 family)
MGGRLRIVFAALLLAAILTALYHRDLLEPEQIAAWVQARGAWAPVLFIALYALGTVLFFPGSLMTLLGGALFGPALGTLYNLAGATIGAALAFVVARHLGSEWVARRAGGRLKQLIAGVEAEGWRFVAFVRLVPLFPFNLLNYALGMTRIRWTHYVAATFVCMIPGALALTYLGYLGREAAAGAEDLVQKGLLALALLAIAVFLPRLIARWRRPPVLD